MNVLTSYASRASGILIGTGLQYGGALSLGSPVRLDEVVAKGVGVREYQDIAALFEQHLTSHKVREFCVFGLNALKSLSPPVDALAGQTVGACSPGPGATFSWLCGSVVVLVDLQRVGVLRWSPSLDRWTPGTDSPMPTAQLLLEGGGGINFSEPNKTKRMTFRLSDHEPTT